MCGLVRAVIPIRRDGDDTLIVMRHGPKPSMPRRSMQRPDPSSSQRRVTPLRGARTTTSRAASH